MRSRPGPASRSIITESNPHAQRRLRAHPRRHMHLATPGPLCAPSIQHRHALSPPRPEVLGKLGHVRRVRQRHGALWGLATKTGIDGSTFAAGILFKTEKV